MSGWGPKANGTVRIHIGEIVRIDFKPGTAFKHGYIQFIRRGKIPAPIQRGGLHHGLPHMYDPDSISVPKKANESFRRLRAAVSAACGIPPPSPHSGSHLTAQTATPAQPHQSPQLLPAKAQQPHPGRARFTWAVISRTLLWMFIAFLALGTIITGATTIAGKWEERLGSPIFAILCYGIPLIASLSLGIWDIRNQQRRAAKMAAGRVDASSVAADRLSPSER